MQVKHLSHCQLNVAPWAQRAPGPLCAASCPGLLYLLWHNRTLVERCTLRIKKKKREFNVLMIKQVGFFSKRLKQQNCVKDKGSGPEILGVEYAALHCGLQPRCLLFKTERKRPKRVHGVTNELLASPLNLPSAGAVNNQSTREHREN